MTVTTTQRSVEITGSGGTVFTVPFPFVSAQSLRVTKVLIATDAETVLSLGPDYSVTLPLGATSGKVTTVGTVSSSYKLRIERQTPNTQETSFGSQGAFFPITHERAFDKLVMAAQDQAASVAAEVAAAVADLVPAPTINVLNDALVSPVSVKDTRFAGGAKGDGVTDDTDAINAAIESVRGVGGALHFPRGVYMFTHLNFTYLNVIFQTSVTITGDGPMVSKLQQINGSGGVAVDASASNQLHWKDIGIYTGTGCDIGYLVSRLSEAGNNVNNQSFSQVWFRGEAAKAAFVGIGNECTFFDNNCWFDSTNCAFASSSSNAIGAVSAHGTVMSLVSNTANSVKNSRFDASDTGGKCILLQDGCGIEFQGCQTYSATGTNVMDGHFVIEAPTYNASTWPITIVAHHFEGFGPCVLFKDNPDIGALYTNFTLRDSYTPNPPSKWIDIDGTGVRHANLLFDGNRNAGAGSTNSIHLQDIESSRIIYIGEAAAIAIDGTADGCVIVGPYEATTIGNPIGCILEYITPFVNLGKNYVIYGNAIGRAARWMQITPAHVIPDAGQIVPGMLTAADPVTSPGWDPATLGYTEPYLAWTSDGTTFRVMTDMARRAFASWNPGLIADGDFASTTFTVTGAVKGDIVNVAFGEALPDGVFLNAQVTDDDEVTCYCRNESGGPQTIGTATTRVVVTK